MAKRWCEWQRWELAEQIATGAAIYNLLRQGFKLFDIVDALDLADCREAQRLVALYLLHGDGDYVVREIRQEE